MIVNVRVEDCYCGVPTFYENVAQQLPNYSDSCRFDCRKILVSESVANTLEDYFLTENGGDKLAFAMMWLNYGPKVVESLNGFDVEILDGFLQIEN